LEDKKTILIVEDEPRIRGGLVDFLEFHGFSPVTAADGMEAEAVVSKKRFED